MRTPDAGGRRRFSGVLRGAEAGQVTVEVDGAGGRKEQVALALDDVERARLVAEL